ncbi:MAG: ribosome hibernation-promoting factor, HPF/YfiA family [Salinarimonas sp.]
MTLRISGKNMDIGDALRAQVQERVDAAVAKYFDGSVTGHVTVEKEGTGFRTECVIHLPTGVTLESQGMAHDAYAAFDQSAHRIEKRLRRHKRRLRDHQSDAKGNKIAPVEAAYAILEAPAEEVDEEADVAEEGYSPVVIAESTRALHRRSVAEAVLELDLSGAPFMIFLHAGTGRVNVVYRRHDGAIGWIDPPEPAR